MYEDIKARYEKGYIRDDQLDRYVKLNVITEEQAEQLKMEKIGGGGVTKPLIIIRINGVEVQVYA